MVSWLTGFFIIFATFANSLPYLSGLLATPKDSIFLGTVHHPFDYFYYLSQFAQGAQRWFTAYDLYTADSPLPTPIGWVNVLLGRWFFLLGVPHTAAYQLSVAALMLSLLILVQLLLKQVFATGKYRQPKQLLALALFIFNTSLPLLTKVNGKLQLIQADYWNNFAVPSVRFDAVPHHFVISIAIVLALLLAGWWREWHTKNWKVAILIVFGLSLTGLVLGSLQPVQLILVALSLFFSGFILNLLTRPSRLTQLFNLSPSLILFMGGLPPMVYLQNLFTQLPYSQLASWEAAQQINLNFVNFLLATGPVALLGAIGLVFLLRPTSLLRTLLMAYALLSLGLFFSPLGRIFHLTNVRFLSPLTILALSCGSSELFFQLFVLGPRRWKILLTVFFTLLVSALIPVHWQQTAKRLQFDPTNAYYYISQPAYTAYTYAQKVSQPQEVFLVIWPYNISFAGITGRREFNGHPLLTINAGIKDQEALAFFSGNLPLTAMDNFLGEKGIAFVIAYPWTFNQGLPPTLAKIYENSALTIYSVQK